MEARVILTEETKNSVGNLGSAKKGKILFSRLEELDKSGELSKAKNRNDVAKMVGYMEGQMANGYAWVSKMVNGKYLTETFRGYDKVGKVENEYHLSGNKPMYENWKSMVKRGFQVKRKAIEPVSEVKEEAVQSVVSRMVVEKDGVKISVDAPVSELGKLIKDILA